MEGFNVGRPVQTSSWVPDEEREVNLESKKLEYSIIKIAFRLFQKWSSFFGLSFELVLGMILEMKSKQATCLFTD